MKWPDIRPRSYCGGGISSLMIFQDGNVGICDMIPNEDKFILGNLKEKSLAEIWRSGKAEFLRKIPAQLLNEECNACKYYSVCRTGCFNLSKIIYGDYFAPDPRCPIIIKDIKTIDRETSYNKTI